MIKDCLLYHFYILDESLTTLQTQQAVVSKLPLLYSKHALVKEVNSNNNNQKS